MKYEHFRQNWSFQAKQKGNFKVIEERNISFLNYFCVGYVLNVCCGLSNVGDVLVDVDLKTLKINKNHRLDYADYICADLFNLPFRKKAFDTIICDPPYSYYNHIKWVAKLSDYAKYRLILSSPPLMIRVKGFKGELYYIKTPNLFLRLWWVFTVPEKKIFTFRIMGLGSPYGRFIFFHSGFGLRITHKIGFLE